MSINRIRITPTPSNTATNTPTITPTQTNCPDLTPTNTPTNTITPSITPTNTITPTITSTPNPFCPEQLILTQPTAVNYSAYTGTYDRLYSWSGGNFNYAYYVSPTNWVFNTPDANGNYGLVYGRFDGTYYYTIYALALGGGIINIYAVQRQTGNYSVGIAPVFFGLALDSSLTTTSNITYPIGSGSNNFYISYPAICPTTTPTPTNTPSITPTNTPTSTIQITPSNTATITNTPTNTATPSLTPTQTITPTCGTFTTQYMQSAQQGNKDIRFTLFNNPNFTGNANAVCDYTITGTFDIDGGAINQPYTTIMAQNDHNHTYDTGSNITGFTISSVVPVCPCVLVVFNQITPTPTLTPTNTPTNTQTSTPTGTIVVSPTMTSTPTITPTITNTPSSTPQPTPVCQQLNLYPDNTNACDHLNTLTLFDTDNALSPTILYVNGGCGSTPVVGNNLWFSQGAGATSYQVDNGGFVINTFSCP